MDRKKLTIIAIVGIIVSIIAVLGIRVNFEMSEVEVDYIPVDKEPIEEKAMIWVKVKPYQKFIRSDNGSIYMYYNNRIDYVYDNEYNVTVRVAKRLTTYNVTLSIYEVVNNESVRGLKREVVKMILQEEMGIAEVYYNITNLNTTRLEIYGYVKVNA
jgi:hypothetical protein